MLVCLTLADFTFFLKFFLLLFNTASRQKEAIRARFTCIQFKAKKKKEEEEKNAVKLVGVSCFFFHSDW